MKNYKTIKRIKFYLDDYKGELGDYDLFDEVESILKKRNIEIDYDVLGGLDIVFTNGYAYCDVPNLGRVKWSCETDTEWMGKRKPSEFDIYDDIKECGVNRWQIWYVTQYGKPKVVKKVA